MADKLMDCIINPVKCKLLLEIHSRGKATAKHLSDTYSDIPPATLYRHLKKMLSDGMETMLEENSGELYMQYFMQYMIGFAKQFQQYCQSPNINIKEDMTGFSLSPLYLSDQELTSLVTDISHIIRNVKDNKPNPERKLRTIGIIISPEEKRNR